MRKCEQCGTLVAAGESFCPDCGMSLGEVEGQPDTSTPDDGYTGTASPFGGAAQLILLQGASETSYIFPLSGRIVVGRRDPSKGQVDIDMSSVPDADYISRRHAEFFERDGQWYVVDLGSTNGTELYPRGGNPTRLSVNVETPINDGDEIVLGRPRFVFRTSVPSA